MRALLDRLDAQSLRALGGKLALLGRAALALDRGDATTAIDLAERFLRGVPSEDQVERIDGLELLARAPAVAIRLKRHEVWPNCRLSRRPLARPHYEAWSVLSKESWRPLAETMKARRQFEDAVDLFDVGGAPYEAARSRLERRRSPPWAVLTLPLAKPEQHSPSWRRSGRRGERSGGGAPASSGAAAERTGDEAAALA